MLLWLDFAHFLPLLTMGFVYILCKHTFMLHASCLTLRIFTQEIAHFIRSVLAYVLVVVFMHELGIFDSIQGLWGLFLL